MLLDAARLIFQRVVIGERRDRDVAIAIESLRIVAHGRALNVQRHANRTQQISFVAFIGDVARRYRWGAEVGIRHAFQSNKRMCKRCGPWTPRTSGPMSAVALGPV